MLVVIVGGTASGKTTLLQEFLYGAGCAPLVIVDDCTMDLFVKLYDITLNNNVIIATHDNRLTVFADVVIYAKGAQAPGVYNKTMIDKNGTLLIESDNRTVASDVKTHYFIRR